MKNVLKIDNIINKLSKGKLEAVRKHEAIKSNFTNTPRNIEFDKLIRDRESSIIMNSFFLFLEILIQVL